MATLNKVLLIGNLTRDPELRSTPKGTPFCLLGVALNRRFKDEDGNQRDETTFVDVEAWGKQAEFVSKYLRCGSPAFIGGRLKLDQWEDKEKKQKRHRLKIIMEEFQFVSSGGNRDKDVEDGNPNREHEGRGRGKRGRSGGASLPNAQPGEDIPF